MTSFITATNLRQGQNDCRKKKLVCRRASRNKLDKIERYGIKCGVRYLVKDVNELGVEVDGAIFDSAYTESGASWREEEDIKTIRISLTEILALLDAKLDALAQENQDVELSD